MLQRIPTEMVEAIVQAVITLYPTLQLYYPHRRTRLKNTSRAGLPIDFLALHVLKSAAALCYVL